MNSRVRFLDKLYIGETAKKRQTEIRWRLRLFRRVRNLFVIVVSGNDGDQLEIMDSRYLKQGYFRRFPPVIAGFAFGYDEAVDVIVSLAEEVYRKTGSCDIKGYIA